MPDRPSPLVRWLREPIVHFLVLGAALFLFFQWKGGSGGLSKQIVITPGQMDAIVAGFVKTWQRPPTPEELKAQLDEYVRDEIATREATAMGLDRDDTIIRRRLRQKLEFVAEDALNAVPPTDQELQRWLDAHADDFRTEPAVAFRQVMLSRDVRGASVESDARALLSRLARAGADADIDELGDSVLLPPDVAMSSRTDVTRMFGEAFADAIFKVEPGRWAGPIESGYGLHLVHVLARNEGKPPALADVRPQVEREVMVERRKRQLDEMYAKLLEGYDVRIERRDTAGPAPKEKQISQR